MPTISLEILGLHGDMQRKHLFFFLLSLIKQVLRTAYVQDFS